MIIYQYNILLINVAMQARNIYIIIDLINATTFIMLVNFFSHHMVFLSLRLIYECLYSLL